MRIVCVVIVFISVIIACSHPRDGYYSHGEIPIVYRHEEGIAGRWEPNTRTVYLSSLTNRHTLAHELCHACDTMGLTLQEVVVRVGTTTAPGQDILQLVLVESRKIYDVDAHWIALGRVCGKAAIGHQYVLDRMRHKL